MILFTFRGETIFWFLFWFIVVVFASTEFLPFR